MYLVDTNVWLERLLAQERSDEVGRFLSGVPSERLHLTDFSFHSICLALTRHKLDAALRDFVRDSFQRGAVGLVALTPTDSNRVLVVMRNYNLDFDDAYQYVAAEKRGLTLVSYDTDFDRTERGRKTPQTLLDSFNDEPDPDFVARERPSASRRKAKGRKRG